MDPWLEPAPDFTDAGLAAAYDELSLWAAPFGMALLSCRPSFPGWHAHSTTGPHALAL
jgi:hypothetical protein